MASNDLVLDQVTERKAKERELQMKTAQLQQQAVSLCIEAQTKEHMAANVMRMPRECP